MDWTTPNDMAPLGRVLHEGALLLGLDLVELNHTG